ncbi:MAG TPA: hypothetical protein VHX11_03840 [Acidobacteriaceae bacterium]|nr:hypothetical protein [Acidobacteriaceae bacterium]
MPAYCSCCGAEITLKAEACTVCGTPRHGMMPAERPALCSDDDAPSQPTNASSSQKDPRERP